MVEKIKKVAIHLSKSKILFDKNKGQHILQSKKTIQKIVDKAGIFPSDIVLEIGPGTGNLTLPLLQKAKKVIAVEIDKRLILELKKRFIGTEYNKKLEIINGDALKTDFPFFNILVANIPYQISSPLIQKLLDLGPKFRCAVIMFQKEFADRLVAKPGDKNYSRLTVNTQMFTRIDHLLKVGKALFKPPPKVDSSVVRIEPKRPYPKIDKSQWKNMLLICFHRKNKTIGAAFRTKSHLKQLEKFHNAHCLENKTVFLIIFNTILNPFSKKTPFEEFKSSLDEFLIREGYSSRRSAKMSCDDYVVFLNKLNKNKFYLSYPFLYN
ncbi:dimethyladenosine transferase [Bonamia ostreae]|uniref:rRNA adenine N(6)-methyltransferase n=1 Tax=Bonamia ostreae TaxID=126728 RepID=A0ABV2AN08_9EUKA